MYTRCPKCSTCFRVTDRHLAIAKGKVRCGKCQLVFNATENAIDDLPSNPTSSQTLGTTRPSVTPTAKTEIKKPVTPAPTQADKVAAVTPTKDKIEKPAQTAEVKKEKAAAPPSKVAPPKIAPPLFKADATMVADTDDLNIELDKPTVKHNSVDDDDDFFDKDFDLDAAIDELTEHADEITYDHDITDQNKVTPATKPESSTPKEKQSDDVFTTDAYDATNASSVADILNEMEGQLVLDIPDPNNEVQKENYDADDEFEFIELDDEPDAVTESATEEVEDTNDEFIKNNFDIEEFDIDDEIDDLSAEKEKSNKKKKDEVSKEEELFDDFDTDIFDDSDIKEEIIIEETSLDKDKEAKIGMHSDGYEVPMQLRDDIESLQASSGRRLHPALKFTFVIFLLALSFTQLAYFRSHELVSIIPSSRPFLEPFCENIGCQYSGPSDTKQIQLQSRDVRLHPKEKKALLISAAMINNAYFAQPYPNIHIRLSDISGNIVAERIFNPKTYMGKLSNPFLLMRSKTPVHINFEVVDPGKDAVNFEFTFL